MSIDSVIMYISSEDTGCANFAMKCMQLCSKCLCVFVVVVVVVAVHVLGAGVAVLVGL